MSTEKSVFTPAAAEVINQVSGTYSAPFWDGLLAVTESPETVREVKGAIEALHTCGKNDEAYHLILALYDLTALETPTSIVDVTLPGRSKAVYQRIFTGHRGFAT